MGFSAINNTVNTPTMTFPVIEEAFAAEHSLKERIYEAIESFPQQAPLFEDIARYARDLLAKSANASQHPAPESSNEGPAAKKRKVQAQDGDASGDTSVADDSSLQFYMKDVSFAAPQRKKLTLEITAGRGYVRARNQTSKDVEFGVPIEKIRHVLCLPVPEKTQRQFNICVIPQYADGVNPPPEGEAASESMVWMIPDGPAKTAFSGTGQQVGNADGEKGEGLVRRILDENLSQTKVVRPDEREFASAVPEAHRKGEKAYHVKAFRGSKEGYLFFLSTGIFFGFKKPLLFFAFENIETVSYTSVLQRTFNLNIVTQPTTKGKGETQEFELSMIDQADFAGIDAYVKKHGLQDASLAEERRAKQYQGNGVKTGTGTGTDASAEGTTEAKGGEKGEGESELQKAQREIEDLEDEQEEDYDPGSDGESEGSGSSSEEDGEEGEEEGEEGEEEEEDIAEELGSEAEDGDGGGT